MLESSTHLAKLFGYSAMTIVRALDEIEAMELAERYSSGKERLLRTPIAIFRVVPLLILKYNLAWIFNEAMRG